MSKVSVIDDILPTPLVDAAYDVFRLIRIEPGSLYIPRQEMDEGGDAPTCQSLVAAQPVANLLTLCCRRIWPFLHLPLESIDGFEIWTSCAEEYLDNVIFHIDNDETHRARTGELRTPLAGVILYLGPAGSLDGGGTFFCLDDAVARAYKRLMFKPKSWTNVSTVVGDAGKVISFRRGRCVIFDGNIAHCAIPFSRRSDALPRVALLLNAWGSRLSDAKMC